MRDRAQIRFEGLEGRVLRTFSRTDEIRVAGLEQASLLREAKALVVRRERARRVAKHGETSTEAAEADRRLAAQLGLRAEVASELAAASIGAPSVDAEHFVLYGRVVDPSRRPLRDHAVTAAVPEEEESAKATTDAAGRFVLALAAERADAPPVEQDVKQRGQDPKQATSTASAQSASREPSGVRLAVSDPDGRTVLTETLAVERTGGRAVYRELVVGRRTRGKPPSEQRDAWHSARGAVHHTNPDCTTGNNIEEENLREGTGGKPLCSECAELDRRARGAGK